MSDNNYQRDLTQVNPKPAMCDLTSNSHLSFLVKISLEHNNKNLSSQLDKKESPQENSTLLLFLGIIWYLFQCKHVYN